MICAGQFILEISSFLTLLIDPLKIKIMEQKFIFIFVFITLFFSSKAQQDTLFYENFNSWPFQEMDSIFLTYDEDNMADYNGLPGNWFVANFANSGADSLEVVAMSSSWLSNFANGNRNHMQLPGLYIADTNAVLSWRSAPALGALYMDGYTVIASTDSLCLYYVGGGCPYDTLLHFAQNINNNETQFSSGIQHQTFDLNVAINITTSTQYPGLLTPSQVSLRDYAGQRIFINFLHNSDDDNYIAIDDILIKGTKVITDIEEVGSTSEETFKLYPNPSNKEINLDLSTLKSSVQNIRIYSSLGQEVLSVISNNYNKTETIDISTLNKGIYFVNILTDNGLLSSQFVKN